MSIIWPLQQKFLVLKYKQTLFIFFKLFFSKQNFPKQIKIYVKNLTKYGPNHWIKDPITKQTQFCWENKPIVTTVNTKPILLIKLALARTRNFYKISGRGDYREGRGRRKKKEEEESRKGREDEKNWRREEAKHMAMWADGTGESSSAVSAAEDEGMTVGMCWFLNPRARLGFLLKTEGFYHL